MSYRRIKTNQRLFVTSDSHGRYYEFEQALKKANFNYKKDLLIHCGDFIDRGLHSNLMVNKLIQMEESGNAIVISGNHEIMFLDMIYGNISIDYYIKNGGERTLKSYNINSKLSPETIRAIVGEKTIEWLRHRPLYYETDQYIFVHAGIRPGVPMEQQQTCDLLLIREEFYMKYTGPKIVFFGHTRTKRLCKENHIWYGVNCYGIDTGAGGNGFVTILDIVDFKCYKIKVRE